MEIVIVLGTSLVLLFWISGALFSVIVAFINLVPTEREESGSDYDYGEDEDYKEALATADRLDSILEGSAWSNARQLVDEKLPELLELQNEIGLDLDDTEERIKALGNTRRDAARCEALRANLARQQALYDEVSTRVDATKAALEQLLVIVRECQVNGAPDAAERVTRLLTETQRDNELLLRTRREVEAVGRT
ncbi:hypothetical protein A2348_01950 [Candidatus Uhrbacteria bacterium RIFOXYB12_FULL_58_10]|nr:MAG: hypothetical protein A2348_01950 [Candidatus Uhrbacteria bacterium RIFOXYB12_FULL_58_10]